MADYIKENWAHLDLISEARLDNMDDYIAAAITRVPSTNQVVQSDVDGVVPLTLKKRAAGDTADLLRVVDESGTELVVIEDDGLVVVANQITGLVQATGATDAVAGGRSLAAGAGLTGGGDLTGDRTFNIGAGTGITVNADDIQINQAFSPTWAGNHTFNGTLIFPTATSPAQTAEGSVVWDSNDDKLTVGDGSARQILVNETRTISTATGLTGGGDLSADRTIDFDLNALTTEASPNGASDFVVIYDGSSGTHKKATLGSLPPADDFGFTEGSIPYANAAGGLAEDNANLFYDVANTRLGIGNAAPQAPLHIGTAGIDSGLFTGNETVITSAEGTEAEYMGMVASNTAIDAFSMNGRRARGTLAAPTTVQDGDNIYEIEAEGFDGTGIIQSSEIIFRVDGAVSAGTVPMEMLFRTGPNNAGGMVDRMVIKSDGTIGINIDEPDSDALIEMRYNGAGAIDNALVVGSDVLLTGESTSLSYNIIGASDTAGSVTAKYRGKRAGGTLASPTAAPNGSVVVGLAGDVFDGTSMNVTAEIRSTITGPVSTGVAPQRWDIRTGETNGASAADRLRVDPDGTVTIFETLNIQSGTGLDGTLDASAITANRTWEWPNESGHVALRHHTEQWPVSDLMRDNALVGHWRLDDIGEGDELLSNPSFETYTTSPGTPDGWNSIGNPTEIAKEITLVKSVGNSVKITSDGGGYDGIYQTIQGLETGKAYHVEGWSRTSGSGSAGEISRFLIHNHTDSSDIVLSFGTANSETWEKHSGTFYVDDDADEYRMYLQYDTGAASGDIVYFDEITVKEITFLDSSKYGNNGNLFNDSANLRGFDLDDAGAIILDGDISPSPARIDVTADNTVLRAGHEANSWTMVSVFKRNGEASNTESFFFSRVGFHGGIGQNIPGAVPTNVGAQIRDTTNNEWKRVHYDASDNEEHVYVLTFDGSTGTMTLYVDGVSESTNTLSAGYTFPSGYNDDLYIGRNLSFDRIPNGTLRDCMMFERELSVAEVLELSKALEKYHASPVGVGNSAPQAPLHIGTAGIDSGLFTGNETVITSAEGTEAEYMGIVASDAAIDAYSMNARRSRGTLASPTAVQDGDHIFEFEAEGFDGTNKQQGAEFLARVDGAVSAGAVPMEFLFRTGSAQGNLVDRLLIGADGTVTVFDTFNVQSGSGFDGELDASNIGADRTWTFPDETGEVALVRTLTAGSGLTGGGDSTDDRAVALGIDGLTADTAPNMELDYMATYDDSAGAHKKVNLGRIRRSYDSIDSTTYPSVGDIIDEGPLTYAEISNESAMGYAPGIFGQLYGSSLANDSLLAPLGETFSGAGAVGLPRGVKYYLKGVLKAKTEGAHDANFEQFTIGVAFHGSFLGGIDNYFGHTVEDSRDTDATVAVIIEDSTQDIKYYNCADEGDASYTDSTYNADVTTDTAWELIVEVPDAANSNDDLKVTIKIEDSGGTMRTILNAVAPVDTATNVVCTPLVSHNLDGASAYLAYKVELA